MLLIKRLARSYSNYNRISFIENKKPGDTLSVQGWIQNIRRLKNNIFLDISDGSSSKKFQVVVPKNDRNKNLQPGSSIRTTGIIQVAPNGNFELHSEDIAVIGEGALSDGYPFTPKQTHPPEYVREHLHLRSRVDYIASQFRIRHKVVKAIHDFMDANDFVNIQTPILTTNDCEGAGEVFSVKPNNETLLKEMSRAKVPLEQSYFDEKVYLSVSGQLHLEAMTYGLGNTYTFSPAFRAENSKSPLHLSEFYMFEAELAFIDEMKYLTAFIERMLKSVTKEVLSKCKDEKLVLKMPSPESKAPCSFEWLEKPWTTITYDEALQKVLANKGNFKTEVKPNEGFSKEQELFLVSDCQGPVFIVEWPKEQKPFYMKISRKNASNVEALDLLMPGVGELCGGSLRESDYARLRDNKKLPDNMEWYLDLRKFGGFPTGGFGLGFERYLQLITGVKNIRDVIPFPRYPHSCRM